MKHLQQLMAEPSAGGLSDVMKTQQRLVEQMLFRTIELTSLVEAGQHRFIGRALDELEQAERELGQTELLRAAMTEAILGSTAGAEPTLSELLSAVDEDSAEVIRTTAAQIRTRLAQIEEVRHEAASTATERAGRARRALSTATSDAGLYGRA